MIERHNMITTYLVLYISLNVTRYNHGKCGVCCGVQHQDVGSRPFGSCRLHSVMTKNHAYSDIESLLDWDPGNLEAMSTCGAVCGIPLTIPEQLL